ncbi:MAG: lytic transglycosylase F [Desulfuromonadales bacterium]|nr:lytic transglycosylase F [Desulfuromonadales bacterium]NIR33683.1 lytic transglycosylase F [Desulfuromonadales bacterium]NIS44005.1 lytic transglycosylase F [Desulfuromonadales bacterium]
MKVRKWFLLIVVAVMSLPLVVSCDRQASDSSSEADLAHPLGKHLDETFTGDLPAIVERKHLRVLTNFNRTNFFLKNGQLYGFEYSLIKEYEKFINSSASRSDLRLTVEFVPVRRDRLIPDLVAGRGDIAAAGLTITPARQKRVDFTRPYIEGVDEVVVTHRRAGLESLEDLSGREVFVRRSSSYYESLVELSRRFEKQGLAPVDIVEADETLETEDILELVNSGAVKITIADSHLAKIWAKAFDDIRVHGNLAVRTGGEIAWMVRENNPELKASLNRFLKSYEKGTLMGNIYFNRYFRDTKWISNPLSTFEDDAPYVALFRKYGDKYGFDWRLLMALGYQESGLDHDKRSHAGAVGIMQIRPSTASDPNVGINDISSMERNIHAGVKYLAFLRDRYFDAPEIQERQRVRLALAAYNAGPGRILEARGKAEQMGRDPNKWFRNVEMAVLKLVGQETVKYVSNINKYYLIFSRAAGNIEERERMKERI